MGPNLLFHLGGGQGGIHHFMEHLSGPMTTWWKDLGNPEFTPELKEKISQGVLGPNGQPVSQISNIPYWNGIPQNALPASCAALANSNVNPNPTPACAQALAHYRAFITYQPASRFWTFQGIEAGIFVILAAALIAVTAMVLLRRDA